MLTEDEIVALRNNKQYRKLTGVGWGWLTGHAVKDTDLDFKQDLGIVKKVIFSLAKQLKISHELSFCGRKLIEQMLDDNYDNPKTPEDIRVICEAKKNTQLWMRYDKERVHLLFDHSMQVIKDAEFRALVLNESRSYYGDKRKRLNEITSDLHELKEITIQTILQDTIFVTMQDIEKAKYYREQYGEMKMARLAKQKGGRLGDLSVDLLLNDNETPVKQLPPADEEKQ